MEKVKVGRAKKTNKIERYEEEGWMKRRKIENVLAGPKASLDDKALINLK